jgi:hypothetical protein
MPSPEDLGDLFNFEFNKKCSMNNGSEDRKSQDLFINKFKQCEGLIKKLKSQFDISDKSPK